MATKGEASVVLTFSHYAIIPGRLCDSNSLLYETVNEVRKKKGLGDFKSSD